MRSKLLALSCVCLAALAHATTYQDAGHAVQVFPGTCQTVIGNVTKANPTGNEQPTTGYASTQVSLPTGPNQPLAAISVEFQFAGNPGAFSYQIQDADTDAPGNYVTVANGTMTSCPVSRGGSYTCRAEFNPWRGNFLDIYVATQTANAVNVVAKVCR